MSNENERPELETSLLRSISEAGVGDVAIDTAELALDSLLWDGLLKEIPVVGTLARLGAAGMAIRDYLFVRKLIGFLRPMVKVDSATRGRFAERLASDPQERRQVGGALLLLLERLDDLEKAEFLGRLFRAHLDGQLTLLDFEGCAWALDRTLLYDLKQLPVFDGYDDSQRPVSERLAQTGLVRPQVGAGTFGGGAWVNYVMTELGSLIKSVLFDDE